MQGRFLRITLAIATLAIFSVIGGAQKIDNENPDKRAEEAEAAAKANSRAAATAIMAAIATESDGPAGFRMAEAISQLTSEEAMAVIERQVMNFSKPENVFGAYWTFIGLARQNTEAATAILRKAVLESKEPEYFLRAAAIEALAYTSRSDQGDLLLETLKGLDPKRFEGDHVILTLSCAQAAPKIVDVERKELRDKIVLELANLLEKASDERVQWYTCTALSEITGEDKYTDPEFWRWWVQVGGIKVKRSHEGPTVAGRDVPKFFEAAAVGKRVVFVIDISGSMQHPVTLPPQRTPPPKEEPKREGPVTGDGKKGDDKKEEKREIPPPDYSRVKIKLDLAKVELIHTLTHLPEDYLFNIVIYHTPHMMIDGGTNEFVPATEANKKKFIKRVEALNYAELTNIHGALNRAFCINSRKSLDPMKIDKRGNNPAWDPECLKSGATTIFFLTDGSPTISDDTTNAPPRRVPAGTQPPPFRGNGRMIDPNNIVQDVLRLNTFRKVVINTIGIGPHHRSLMRRLAEMSGGQYVDRSGVAEGGD